MDNLENLLIYDRMPLLIPKTSTLKKTKKFEARLEEAAVLPYLVPGSGLTMVLRPLELVTSPTRIAAYENLVVCDGHPPDGTAHKVGKGVVLSAEVFNDGLNGSIVIHDEALLEKIYEGGITELSPGYMADLVYAPGIFKGVSYTHRHTNYAIGGVERLEHQAIVKHGRHGRSTALKIEDGMAHAVALTWDESRSIVDLDSTKIIEDEAMATTIVNTKPANSAEPAKPDPKAEALDEASETPDEKAEELEEEQEEAIELSSILDGVEALLKKYMSCPTCDAAKTSATPPKPASIESALQLDEDAIGGVIELARAADSLGVAYEVGDLTRNLRTVQNKVAAKLNLKVEDGYSDREVGILIRGSMATAPTKTTGISAAVSAIKAAQVKAASPDVKAKAVNPLSGLA